VRRLICIAHGRREKDKEYERRERSEEGEGLHKISAINTKEQIRTRKERRVIVKWKVGSVREVVERGMGSRVPAFILTSTAKSYHGEEE
jgi:hypothetical protein